MTATKLESKLSELERLEGLNGLQEYEGTKRNKPT